LNQVPKITAYMIKENENRVRILPARREREWMDNTNNQFAYRCLPLSMANMHGWEIFSNEDISFTWNGENDVRDITIHSGSSVVSSVFGSGIITMHIMHVLETPSDYNLYITGSPNFFVPGIQPITGIFESNWAPYTFTMNWKITEPNKIISFTKNDPFCFFFPINRNLIESFKFEILPIEANLPFKEHMEAFHRSRVDFIKFITDANNQPVDQKDAWQKHYFQGKYIDGTKCPFGAHKTKFKLDQPNDHKDKEE